MTDPHHYQKNRGLFPFFTVSVPVYEMRGKLNRKKMIAHK